MRVLINAELVSREIIEQIERECEAELVVCQGRRDLERQLQASDIVVSCFGDLARLGTRDKPDVGFGSLCISPFCATYDDRVLQLHRLDIAILYELASAQGRVLPRRDLQQRCWRKHVEVRTVDVAVHRLRCELERQMKDIAHSAVLSIVMEREQGYR